MSFLSPGFAWLFLSLPVIVILYLLRPRHTEKPVPSTLLWQRALRQEQALRPFQKLRRHLLLPLQLLTAALLTLCLMHPVLPSGEQSNMIFVFDLSASMQAVDTDASRLDQARTRALQILESMDPASELTVITQSLSAQCPLSRSTDRVRARQLIRSLQASDGSADLEEAVSLARSFAAQTDAGICIFTDTEAPADPELRVETVGTPSRNLRISAFEVHDGLAFIAVKAYGAGGTCSLKLTGDGTVLDARSLEIADNGQASLSVECPPCSLYTAQILDSDALAPDNTRLFVPDTGRHYTVSLNFDSLFLTSLLSLRSDLDVVRAGSGTEADLYIQGPCPLIFSTEPDARAACGEEITVNGMFPDPGTDPVFQACRFQDVTLRAFRPLKEGTPLLSLGDHTLIARLDSGYALGFDLKDTNLALRYDFPVFMSNMLETLLPSTSFSMDSQECGTRVAFSLPATAEQVSLTLPDGSRAEVRAPHFSDTRLAGLYTLSWQDGGTSAQNRFALFPPEPESDTTRIPDAREGSGAHSQHGYRDLQFLLLGFLLLLLMLEWGVYCRGT